MSGATIDTTRGTPFPLLYEEIYLNALKNNAVRERELKAIIAEMTDEIEPNEIHEQLLALDCKHYLTSNYDYVLQKILLNGESTESLSNQGHFNEKKFSVFRHNTIGDKNFWHVHGEVNSPHSITLGFEHYGGQLQKMRDYVMSGTSYSSKSKNLLRLHKRLLEGTTDYYSWADFIFKDEVHIMGLNLGYEETDLWWLLTNRARFFAKYSNFPKNKITYYCPTAYKDASKTAIMKAALIDPVFIKKKGKPFYQEVIKRVKK